MHIPTTPIPMMGSRCFQDDGLYAQPVGRNLSDFRSLSLLRRLRTNLRRSPMLSHFLQIAPLSTWAAVLGAAFLLLCGFVLMGHAKVVHKAYGAPFHSAIAPFAMETALRWMTACLSGGFLLWGVALGWPLVLLAALGALVAIALGLETIARLAG
ncbi:MAG TPA: hypothetical protein VFI96_02925 [Longimicrobiaceae bacterium]|nr:hypothetical protein [Longimicrobiaceae bacterium]